MPYCVFHSGTPATAYCSACGLPICGSCDFRVGRFHYCPEDAQQGRDPNARFYPTASTHGRARVRHDRRQWEASSLSDSIHGEWAIRWASTIVLVEGILGLVLGFMLMALVTSLRGQAGIASSTLVIANALAVVTLAVSIFLIILSWALRRGHKWAAEIIVVLLMLDLVGEIVSVVSGNIIAAIGMVVSLVVLLLIFLGWSELQ